MPCTEKQKQASREYYASHKDQYKEYTKKWQTENRERYNELVCNHYRKKTVHKRLSKLRENVTRMQMEIDIANQQILDLLAEADEEN